MRVNLLRYIIYYKKYFLSETISIIGVSARHLASHSYRTRLSYFDAVILSTPFSKIEIWPLDDNDNTINMKIAEPSLAHYQYQ